MVKKDSKRERFRKSLGLSEKQAEIFFEACEADESDSKSKVSAD